MRHVFILVALFVSAAHGAEQPAKPDFEWTKAKFDLVAQGDPAIGKELAKEYKCKKCHNEDGISNDVDIPSIAGQRGTYLYKQLLDFKTRARKDSDMRKVARKMSEEDIVHVSAWYNSLEAAPQVGGEPLLVVKICDSCHEKNIIEKDNHIEVAPVLNGQVRQYLERNLMSFREADRSNDLFSRMQSVSHKLTIGEIKRLARYYGGPEIEE